MEEAAEGDVTLMVEGGIFSIDFLHPSIGRVRAEGDRLAEVILAVRRALVADPRFRLLNPPPHA